MIGEQIKNRRQALGLTQEELARRMGYKSKSTINKIELGISLSDADIMATGGWKTDHVMKSVYRKAMRTEEAMKAFGDSMTTS